MTKAVTRAIFHGGIAAVLLALLGTASVQVFAQGTAPSAGQAVAFDRTKGNCLACHTMRGSDVPSNVGPELNDMKARFPDRADLIAILQNEEARNPQTIMPSFGRNLILDHQEIEQIVDFLYSL